MKMSSGGFSRFARRPPSKPTNENAVNNNTQSTALDSAPPEDSTAPSASEFSFGSSWDSSGGFVEQSGGDWLDEGFWETVEVRDSSCVIVTLLLCKTSLRLSLTLFVKL